MAYCTNCGARLQEGARFCTECGTRIAASFQPAAPEPRPLPYAGEQGFTFREGPSRKHLIVLVIAVTIACLLAVCGLLIGMSGARRSDSAVLGIYLASSMKIQGTEVPLNGETLELQSGGKAVLQILDDVFDARWKLDGEELTITQDGDTFRGTLADGVITIDVAGIAYEFRQGGSMGLVPPVTTAETQPVTVPSSQPTEAEKQPVQSGSWWAGDWYGWWVIYEATGSLKDSEDDFWDCCARIRDYGDGTGYVELWDEDNEEDKCLAKANVVFCPGAGHRGIMKSTSGTFLDAPIGDGTWLVDSGDHTYVKTISDMICISGTYVDPADSESTITYLFFLRPWGTKWDDVKSIKRGTELYKDMMPGLYDWYLAQLEAGAAQAPDKIG